MRKQSDEDLFAESTMTIGEHLEELRSKLRLALLGLVAGFCLSMLFASAIVKFIQTPLTDALTSYYDSKAKADLLAEYGGKAPPELLNMIDREKKIPETIEIDPLSILDGLRLNYPDQLADLPFKRYSFVRDDVKIENVSPLCRAIQAGRQAAAGSPERAVWDTLSEEQRRQVETLAKRNPTEQKDRDQFVAILNDVIEKPALRESTGLSDASVVGSFPKPVQDTIEQIREALAAKPDPDQTRRLNRLLLASFYPTQIRYPIVNVVKMTVWKSREVHVQTLSAHEAFMIWVKAAVISGAVIASPWIFWWIWSFVYSGLRANERKFVWVFLPISVGLFLAGAALAFFFVFQPVLDFLFSFNKAMNIDPDPRISEWLSFVLFLPLGFGISFQLPLVMLFLQRIGIFTAEVYLAKYRIAILVIFVLSMFLTPADPISMLLMALPLTVLYFGGIGLCLWMPHVATPALRLPEEP